MQKYVKNQLFINYPFVWKLVGGKRKKLMSEFGSKIVQYEKNSVSKM